MFGVWASQSLCGRLVATVVHISVCRMLERQRACSCRIWIWDSGSGTLLLPQECCDLLPLPPAQRWDKTPRFKCDWKIGVLHVPPREGRGWSKSLMCGLSCTISKVDRLSCRLKVIVHWKAGTQTTGAVPFMGKPLILPGVTCGMPAWGTSMYFYGRLRGWFWRRLWQFCSCKI
jgi:hypothetical protein